MLNGTAFSGTLDLTPFQGGLVTCQFSIAGLNHIDFHPGTTISSSFQMDGSSVSVLDFVSEDVELKGAIDIRNIPSLTSLQFKASSTPHANVTLFNLPNVLGVIDLSMLNFSGTLQIHHSGFNELILPTNDNTIYSLRADNCGMKAINITDMANALKLNNSGYWFHNNGLTSTEVDRILDDFASLVLAEPNGGAYSGRKLRIEGTNSPPGSVGLAAIGVLTDRGVLVTHN